MVGPGLDAAALRNWCGRHLGSEPARVVFEEGYSAQVKDLIAAIETFIDGRNER